MCPDTMMRHSEKELPPEVRAEMERMARQDEIDRQRRRALLDRFQDRRARTALLELAYRLYVPAGAEEGLPMVVLLHGIESCGSDNAAQILNNSGAEDWLLAMDEGKIPPSLLLVPQCPLPIPNQQWEREYLEVVAGIVEDLATEYDADRDRLYLTGLSLGGFGVWNLNDMYPDRFAAVVSCCPACENEDGIRMRDLERCAVSLAGRPLWMFHAEDDMAVPVDITKIMARRLQEAGAEFNMTIYPAEMGVNHRCWVPAYKDAEMLSWLFRQKRCEK